MGGKSMTLHEKLTEQPELVSLLLDALDSKFREIKKYETRGLPIFGDSGTRMGKVILLWAEIVDGVNPRTEGEKTNAA